MNVAHDIPDHYPFDDEPRKDASMATPPTPPARDPRIPIGCFEVKDRETARRILIPRVDVRMVWEQANPRDGAKLLIRDLGYVITDEPYDEVLRRMEEAFDAMRNLDRGY